MPKHEHYLSNNQVFSLVCVTVLALGLGLIVYLDNNIQQRIAKQYEQQIESELERRAELLTLNFITNQHVIDFFHSTPPVEGIVRALQNGEIDPKDNTPLEVWFKRLETIFEAYMENNKAIAQARFIRFDDVGSELIRVEQHKGNIHIVPSYRLQQKADTDYFKRALKLQREEILVSPINLNREWGKIEYPHWPTYRVIRSVFDEQGSPFGFLIINVNANTLLDALNANLPQPLKLFLLNHNQGAIIHPDPDLAFAHEFTPGKAWTDTDERSGSGVFARFRVDDKSQNNFYFLSKTVRTSQQAEGELRFILGFDEQSFKQELTARRSNSVIVIIGLTLIVLAIIGFYQRNVNRRLHQLKKEAEYQAIISGSNDAIITLNLEGIVTGWNKAAEEIFGYSHRLAMGKQVFELLAKEDNVKFSFLSLEKVFEGEAIPAFDLTTQDKRGHEIIISVAMSPISLEDEDEVHGAAAIIRDITEQKVVEQQVQELNQSLEQQVAERTRELEQARNEALEVSRVKSDFIANVSHEIRTPMNGVIGMLRLLAKEVHSEKAQKYLSMANSSAQALTALIDDILDLSKIEAGKLEVDEREFDPFALLSNICGSLAVQANNKGLDFHLDMSKTEVPLIISDDNRIRQILINLIANAIKFTDKGKITVSAQTEFIHNKDLKFICAVKDTGVGIAPNKMQNLFNAFTQVENSTARKYGGTGLGLAISKKLCQLLNGDIHVESDKPLGSTFTFYVTARSASEKFDHSTRIERLQHTKLYLIEPDEDIHQTLLTTLSSLSGNIGTAHRLTEGTLQEIKEHCEQGLECIVFCDAKDERLQQLRAHNNLHTVHLYKHAPEVDRPQHCLSQPFTPMDVFRQLDALNNLDAQTPENLRTDTMDMEMFTLLQQHKGRKILLVDDNQINLEVGQGLIEEYGLKVHTAESGMSALEQLQKETFHLIIMDCQMPGMDGFETTQAIRDGKAGKPNTEIPIIAMTANAMSGAKESCLDSGMNDFITKPINTNELEEKLLFWLNLSDTQAPSNAMPTEESSDKKPSIPPAQTTNKASIWDKQDALNRVKNRVDRLSVLINMFLENMPERVDQLLTSIDQNDNEQSAKIAHEIKGVAGNIGAKQLYTICSQLEMAAKANEHNTMPHFAQSIKSSYQNLTTTLTEFQQDKAS